LFTTNVGAKLGERGDAPTISMHDAMSSLLIGSTGEVTDIKGHDGRAQVRSRKRALQGAQECGVVKAPVEEL